jgi:hypothetical protein
MFNENGKLLFKDAQGFIKTWINRESIVPNQLRAFTIRRTELEFLILQMTITGSDATRFYIGDKANNEFDPPVPCLIMAGVDNFVPNLEDPAKSIPGEEVYFTAFPPTLRDINPSPAAAEEASPFYVLDFAYPCPRTCQEDSPLFNPYLPPPVPKA